MYNYDMLQNLRYAEDLAIAAIGFMHPTSISLVLTSWSGGSPGEGYEYKTITPLHNHNCANPHLTQVSQNDIVVSGGSLRNEDLSVGPFVYPYSLECGYIKGGIDPISLSTSGSGSELYFLLNGPDIPNLQYKKIHIQTNGMLSFRIFLRNTATSS